MKTEKDKQVYTMNLRDSLKEIMQKELQDLPNTLDGLEPKERISVICKLMPYVFPKVQAVHPKEGEPMTWNL